ncbi:MAG TPA: pyruvate dehydrogenase complex dihydrolipoamide acetyltransferase [Cytophagaceae bacterium]|jgi:pyruvate dehydrogenase E2 component (dihydrolipoamide acetyltransferase)|nr:pyruvate dehydrogenase complex dihydrolipoamide acetyltransferase [Cytophagaceae bacterium]
MAEVIRMPKMSDTMVEGVIAAWHKKVGDTVKSGDLLAEVETDKATMELESYETGTLLYIGVNAKEAAPIDGVIAIIGNAGENIDELLKTVKSGGNSNAPKEEKKTEPVVASNTAAPAPSLDLSAIKAEVIRMPKMSDTMTEGTIVAWHKKVGDKVKSGDLLAEVATDKATMELESYTDGTLLYIGVKDGEAVVVDGVLAIVGEAGVDYQPLLSASSAPVAKTETKKEEVVAQNTTSSTNTAASNHAASDSRLKASPLAKKIAKEKGIDIKQVHGSGESGRIVKKDIESFTPASDTKKTESKSSPAISLPQVVGQESYDEVPVSQMRKTIAKRLGESLYSAPHFYLVMEINMDKAMEARTSINEVAPIKISFNDMVIKATAAALRKHPKVNSSWLGDKIRYNHHIHIGVAMAVEEGLLVPVIRFADNKSLSHIGSEVKEFAAKAKSKQLTPADWAGNTFTISNLGMFGIDEFTAIINSPDSCILAVGGIKQTAVVKNGQLVPGNVMKVTLSCDHRVVDGAIGAAFLQTLKSLLEDPIRILA